MKYLRFLRNNVSMIKGTFLLAIVLLIVESVSNYSLIYLQKVLIDDVFVNGQYSWLPAVITLFAIAAIIRSFLCMATSYYLVYNEFRISRSLLDRMLGRMERASIGYVQKDRHGKYVYALTQDLYYSASLLGWQLPRGFQELLNVCLLTAFIGYVSPFLLLIVFLMCVVYISIGYYFSPRLQLAANEVEEHRTALLVQIEEGVASTREVDAFNRTRWEENKYSKLFTQFFDKVIAEVKLVNRQMKYSDPLKWGIAIVVLGFGGLQLMRGNMSLGTFVIVFQFATQMSDAFYNLFQYVMGVSSQLPHIDRVNQILNMEQYDSKVEELNEKVHHITLGNIGFRYEDELPFVIRDVCIELPIGKKIAFVGSSGSGKSTIAELLIRFYDPVEGNIRVNDIPIQSLSRKQWAGIMSIVFQDPYMFPGTVRDNLRLGRSHLTDLELEDACRIAQIHKDIVSLPEGYETNIGERGIKLSGGQRQRLAIARAIVGHPEILVLDEATSALDVETERIVLSALEESRQGCTTIMIAHRLSTIENADVIFVLDKGRLAETGTHSELLTKKDSKYRELLNVSGTSHNSDLTGLVS